MRPQWNPILFLFLSLNVNAFRTSLEIPRIRLAMRCTIPKWRNIRSSLPMSSHYRCELFCRVIDLICLYDKKHSNLSKINISTYVTINVHIFIHNIIYIYIHEYGCYIFTYILIHSLYPLSMHIMAFLTLRALPHAKFCSLFFSMLTFDRSLLELCTVVGNATMLDNRLICQ